MSKQNTVFKFRIPKFFEDYGEDWQPFVDEMSGLFDDVVCEIFQLYWLKDITRQTVPMLDRFISTWDVPIKSTDDADKRRERVREYVSRFADKGLAVIYIDEAEEISGETGEFRPGTGEGWVWGDMFWAEDPPTGDPDESSWPKFDPVTLVFIAFFDAKTLDSGELDAIQAAFQQDFLLPAYYKIFIVDASDVILREV